MGTLGRQEMLVRWDPLVSLVSPDSQDQQDRRVLRDLRVS